MPPAQYHVRGMGKPAPKVGGVPGRPAPYAPSSLAKVVPRKHTAYRTSPASNFPCAEPSARGGGQANLAWTARLPGNKANARCMALCPWSSAVCPPRLLPGCSSPIGALSGTSEPEAKAHQVPTSPEIKHGCQVQRPPTGLGPAPDSPPSPPPGIHRGRRQHRLLTSARCVDPSALGWSGTVQPRAGSPLVHHVRRTSGRAFSRRNKWDWPCRTIVGGHLGPREWSH